jgi:signal transduction histidine kinase
MRQLDWSRSPLGWPETWPETLRSQVQVALGSRFPILLWWGRDLCILYNDAYIPFLGEGKHPTALGRPGRESWSEIWDEIGPMLDGVVTEGRATWSADRRFSVARKLPQEEVFFTFSYSPILSADGKTVAGVYCPCSETTAQVTSARQLGTLRALGERSSQEAKTAKSACEAGASTLGANSRDVPFSAFYLVDDDGKCARLVAESGFDAATRHQAAPSVVDLPTNGADQVGGWPLRRVIEERCVLLVPDLSSGVEALPRSEWGARPHQAIALPLASPDQASAYGVLVCGLSPHRPFDVGYRTFFELAAAQVVTAIRNARAYEAERRRAEQLAELNRAKTAFFSNVSHEFRTPLTLILAPLEETLAQTRAAGQSAITSNLETVQRNATRLLKLVNALLDFSRLEAARMKARYEPTDLARLTRESASEFRSAIESAGLRFDVRCSPLPEPVYVDRDMWEKIVLNLVSNAFKFTFDGGIGVALVAAGDHVELTVCDTGIGVAREELPRIFERFHRIEGARARTHEGSGIGLALVHEIVRLHHGEIRAESEIGRGTTMTVTVPLGRAHLPEDQIGSPRPQVTNRDTAAAFAGEAARWLPTDTSDDAVEGAARAQILVADDNADMREYLTRLLRQRWSVEAVADGEAALAAARRKRFDLVLTDVMMPRLDGFGVLRALRADPALASIPVVMLSARAGEESRIEGLQVGADDYLIKPFSSQEVLARVEVHLKKARIDNELRLSLVEQQALMKEVHHRVKNNLEVVNSLLMLQSDFVNDPQARSVLVETANRVRVIADIHRLLYQTPKLAYVDLASFVEQLAESLFAFYAEAGARVRLDLHAEPVAMDLQRAVPIGLILNELFCNALKHAFPGDRRGVIRVEVRSTGIEFADDGIGLPPSLDPCNSPSLGLQLVQVLVRQIGGRMSVDSGPGARFRVTFTPPPGQDTPVAEDHG